jgi:rare lipoprotein A
VTWQDLIGVQVAGRYTLRTLLYAGRHQSEFLATASDPGETPVSIALVEPEPGEAEQELAAIARARQLRHPNLLQILDAGECVLEDVPMLFIVTEAAQSTLAGTLAAGPAPAPVTLLEDILTALEWLHAQGLVYRNLEPETIVRADGRWKLADLSQLHPAGEFSPVDPARRTVPPEAAAGSILPAWDVWALGVLLRDAIADQRGRLPAPFDAIVRGCLEPDPGRRLSLPDIRKLLKPAPILVPDVQPAAAAQTDEPAPGYVRALIARPALLATAAAVVILGLLAYALLRREPSTTQPPAVPPVSKPAAVPVQPSVPAVAPAKVPAKAPPPASAPAKPTPFPPAQHTGRADYFSDNLKGHPTASGETFSNQAMTAATRDFPIGTRLRVTNLQNGRRVIVRVNDRRPHRHGFIISVTRSAADQLGFVKAGSARVKLEVVK